jgi:hypothetical protein
MELDHYRLDIDLKHHLHLLGEQVVEGRVDAGNEVVRKVYNQTALAACHGHSAKK